MLPETAAQIGDVQVRNRGTIGGSLVHADPAADWPAAILALDAEIDVAGPGGRRVVRADAFFVDLLQTALASDEILVEIRVPKTSAAVAYVKTAQKASGFALAGVAVVVGLRPVSASASPAWPRRRIVRRRSSARSTAGSVGPPNRSRLRRRMQWTASRRSATSTRLPSSACTSRE